MGCPDAERQLIAVVFFSIISALTEILYRKRRVQKLVIDILLNCHKTKEDLERKVKKRRNTKDKGTAIHEDGDYYLLTIFALFYYCKICFDACEKIYFFLT